MLNNIEKKSMQNILNNQNVITEDMFYDAYNHRGMGPKIIEDISVENEKILGIVKDERIWYLQSRYHADAAAKTWAEQYQSRVSDDTVFLVFGLGDGKCIEALRKLNENALILVYEPCADIFWNVFGEGRILRLMEEGGVSIVVEGINGQLYSEYLDVSLNYANFQLAEVCILPNYDKLFPVEYKSMLNKYLYCIKKITLDRNTEILYGQEIIKNTLGLSKDVLEHYSIMQLEGIVQKKKLDEMPAILVAAGPSLDKNIDKLKELQNSAFIMVVDTALNTVLKHDIMPDMTISVDGHKPLELFKHEKVKEIPISLSVLSNKDILEYVSEKRFYELSPEEYLGAYYGEIEKPVQGLATGGSVANNAFSLLVLMGFQTIILMGQDLAYPEGKIHTTHAYESEGYIDTSSTKYVKVKDIYGNDVYTEPNMKCYLEWFGNYISLLPTRHIIDATEGGAFIEGTEISDMTSVIEVYGKNVYNKEVIWEKLEPYLTNEEQETMKDKIRNILNSLKTVEDIIKKGLRDYDKLEQINRKRGTVTSITKLIDKIMEYNEVLDENAEFNLVKRYAISIDYAIKGSVLLYNREDDVYAQIADLVEKGRKLFEGYQQAIKEMKPDLEELLEDFD